MTQPKWNPMAQQFDRPPTLAEFLLARITEDEEIAHHAATKPWRLDGGFSVAVDAGSVLAAGQHMMRWDPSRVLAECEARRKIVGMWDLRLSEPEYGFPGGDPLGGEAAELFYDVLKALAQPYADHPDYREEWKL